MSTTVHAHECAKRDHCFSTKQSPNKTADFILLGGEKFGFLRAKVFVKRAAQFCQRSKLQLTNTLARNPDQLGHLLKRLCWNSVQPEPMSDDRCITFV